MSRQFQGRLPMALGGSLDGWNQESLMRRYGFVAAVEVKSQPSRLPGILRSLSFGDSFSQITSMISLIAAEHTREAMKLIGIAKPQESAESRISAFRSYWPSANMQLTEWQAANPTFSAARASFRMNVHNVVEISKDRKS